MVDFSGVLDLLVVRWQIMVLTCNCRGLADGLMDVKLVCSENYEVLCDQMFDAGASSFYSVTPLEFMG